MPHTKIFKKSPPNLRRLVPLNLCYFNRTVCRAVEESRVCFRMAQPLKRQASTSLWCPELCHPVLCSRWEPGGAGCLSQLNLHLMFLYFKSFLWDPWDEGRVLCGKGCREGDAGRELCGKGCREGTVGRGMRGGGWGGWWVTKELKINLISAAVQDTISFALWSVWQSVPEGRHIVSEWPCYAWVLVFSPNAEMLTCLRCFIQMWLCRWLGSEYQVTNYLLVLKLWGSTSGGVYVPCSYIHTRWELH